MAKSEKIGAFWKKVLPTGKIVYNGSISVGGVVTKINLWENDKGNNPKRPDLNAVLDNYIPKAKA